MRNALVCIRNTSPFAGEATPVGSPRPMRLDCASCAVNHCTQIIALRLGCNRWHPHSVQQLAQYMSRDDQPRFEPHESQAASVRVRTNQSTTCPELTALSIYGRSELTKSGVSAIITLGTAFNFYQELRQRSPVFYALEAFGAVFW